MIILSAAPEQSCNPSTVLLLANDVSMTVATPIATTVAEPIFS